MFGDLAYAVEIYWRLPGERAEGERKDVEGGLRGMDGPVWAEEDWPLVHPYALLCTRDQSSRLLQEETSGQHRTLRPPLPISPMFLIFFLNFRLITVVLEV